VLRVGAALLALVIVGGCGSSIAGNKPEPAITRHLVYEKTVGEKGIWIADVDGSHPRLLAPDGQLPVISPDGNQVAYTGDCYTSSGRDCAKGYVVSSVPGAKPRLLAKRIGWPKTWSPDSKAIVTTQSISEDEDALVRFDVANGEETSLARGRFWGWSISPDGKRIVFAREQGPDPGGAVGVKIDLYVTDLNGHGEARRLTDTGDGWYPVWGQSRSRSGSWSRASVRTGVSGRSVRRHGRDASTTPGGGAKLGEFSQTEPETRR
jgi:Tol biopolymer transport system component